MTSLDHLTGTARSHVNRTVMPGTYYCVSALLEHDHVLHHDRTDSPDTARTIAQMKLDHGFEQVVIWKEERTLVDILTKG